MPLCQAQDPSGFAEMTGIGEATEPVDRSPATGVCVLRVEAQGPKTLLFSVTSTLDVERGEVRSAPPTTEPAHAVRQVESFLAEYVKARRRV
jgi:hypothetical protein